MLALPCGLPSLRTPRLLAVLFTLALTSLWALPALAQEVKISFKVRGFAADQKKMLIEVEDINAAGPVLRVWDLEAGAFDKKMQPIAFAKVNGPKAVREARKKLKFTDPGVEDMLFPLDPADETKTLSFFGLMATKERFVLACTDKQRLGKVKDIPIKSDEESKVMAKANLRGIFWTTDRKMLVAVVSQKIDTESFVSEKDEFHVVKFKQDEIQWVEAPPPPPPKK